MEEDICNVYKLQKPHIWSIQRILTNQGEKSKQTNKKMAERMNRHIIKEESQMAKEHRKKCFISLGKHKWIMSLNICVLLLFLPRTLQLCVGWSSFTFFQICPVLSLLAVHFACLSNVCPWSLSVFMDVYSLLCCFWFSLHFCDDFISDSTLSWILPAHFSYPSVLSHLSWVVASLSLKNSWQNI